MPIVGVHFGEVENIDKSDDNEVAYEKGIKEELDIIFKDVVPMSPEQLAKLSKPMAQTTVSRELSLVSKPIDVLVIVDVQRDYCDDCDGVDVEMNKATGYGMPLADVSQNIAKLIDKIKFQHIIITQDSLKYGFRCARGGAGNWQKVKPREECMKELNMSTTCDVLCPERECPRPECKVWMECVKNKCEVPLLTKGTPGTDVVPTIMQALNKHKREPTFKIEKSMDDWLGTTATVETFDGTVKAERKIVSLCPGGDCSKVNLWITGIQTTRCVFKGALHAAGLGFKVHVPAASTAGGGTSQEDWKVWKAMPGKIDDIHAGSNEWWQIVAGTGSCSPTKEKAMQILKAAGIMTSPA